MSARCGTRSSGSSRTPNSSTPAGSSRPSPAPCTPRRLRFAGEVDDTALADQLSVSSTRVLLRNTLRISSGDAAARVRAAKLLLGSEPITGGQIPAALPQVAAALDDGAIGEGHVSVITAAVKAWPKTLDPDVWTSAEQLLVDTARDGDPGEVSKAAQHLANILDPDGDEPDDAEPECRMELHLGRRNPRTGLTPLKGLLDDEAVETFRQATDPLAAPHPEQNGVKDPRSPALRLAQAHLAALRGYLDAGDGPTVGGHVPHITMVLHYDALTKAIEDAALDFGGPIPPTPPAASPATPRSCPSSSTANPKFSTSAANSACSPPPSAESSPTATAAAPGPAAPAPPAGPKRITFFPGWTADPPTSTTAACSAVFTTDKLTDQSGRSAWPPTADPNSFRHPGSTRDKSRNATTFTNSREHDHASSGTAR